MKIIASTRLGYIMSGIAVIVCILGAMDNIGSLRMFPFIIVGLISAVCLGYFKNNPRPDPHEKDR